MSEEDLELEEFNKLGEQASQGCVRLAVSDAKWVYDNCPTGTNVSIYDDAENAGPLGKPDAIKITDFTNKWDPTDSNKNARMPKQHRQSAVQTITQSKAAANFTPLQE